VGNLASCHASGAQGFPVAYIYILKICLTQASGAQGFRVAYIYLKNLFTPSLRRYRRRRRHHHHYHHPSPVVSR
jgi:hypothetical protein